MDVSSSSLVEFSKCNDIGLKIVSGVYKNYECTTFVDRKFGKIIANLVILSLCLHFWLKTQINFASMVSKTQHQTNLFLISEYIKITYRNFSATKTINCISKYRTFPVYFPLVC